MNKLTSISWLAKTRLELVANRSVFVSKSKNPYPSREN